MKEPPPPKRELLKGVQLIALLEAIINTKLKNGALFRFYPRFLLLTGAREKETLSIKWADVDFQRQVVTIGKKGVAKNGRERDVNFSPELATLISEMVACRPPDTIVDACGQLLGLARGQTFGALRRAVQSPPPTLPLARGRSTTTAVSTTVEHPSRPARQLAPLSR